MKGDYYNEWDSFAAAWLRNLIRAGHLPMGDVDERSIADVSPADLRGYRRCHFFAGIGGWPLALTLTAFPEERGVWTGSCPCQPFSGAGKQRGTSDERHLWPEFHRLIGECRPAEVFGEQVASRLGREWLAGVRADLEALGYAVGAADLCAPSVGAPHIRQRLWWGAARLADANGGLARHGGLQPGRQHGQQQEDGGSVRLGDTSSAGSGRDGRAVPGAEEESRGQRREPRRLTDELVATGAVNGLGDDDDARLEIRSLEDDGRRALRVEGPAPGPPGPYGAWSRYAVVHCTDGKARRFEPGSFPLAHGVSGRVGLLRAYGNTIVPQEAAEFIKAYLECRP